ncbi:SDR family NAD(P)-dependent oxidoreductase [Patiriisocius hiemis]|uniref:SDR family oxidoreductase n=1 Tax=Patiriisocius hiemis TaxID=3075604 RepID=A0ABU2YED1_9FLAO|nr:SDR family oxidoreductase [Constantimarinum sp. W242]MDT0556551.1 SDR family oxidoreductase [Constantimarinum sp. W242]
MSKTALITGASSGIGKEMAILHASRGGNLVVIARSVRKLNELKEELEAKYNSSVYVIKKDLTLPNAAKEVYEEVTQNKIAVNYLINNAGFGGQGLFHERDWNDDLSMIQLNIIALTALTRYFLPDFVKRNEGRVLNVSSTASLMPGPLQAVYFATKAYVTSFSNAISEELNNTNITVTALLPGATETQFAKTSGMDKTDLFAKTYSATKVAKTGYEGMLAGKLNVKAALSFSQRIMMSSVPFVPKKMLLKQIREMQETKEN